MAGEGTVRQIEVIDIPILQTILGAIAEVKQQVQEVSMDGKDLRAAIDSAKTALDAVVAGQQAENATLVSLVARIQAIEVANLSPQDLAQAVTDLQAQATTAQGVADKLQADAATTIPG